MNSRWNKLIKNIITFLLGGFGSKILVLLLMPLYTSILTTSQYGELDIVQTTVSLLMPIVTLGLVDAVFRFVMSKQYNSSNVLSVGLTLCVSCYFIAVLFGAVINRFIHWEYMKIMFLLLFSNMLYEILSNYLKAIQHTKRYVIFGLLQTLISLVLNIVLLVYFKMGVKGYVIAYAVSFLFPALLIFVNEKLFNEITIKKFEFSLMKRMIKYSFPLIFSTLSWWIVTSSDKYMIRFMLGSKEVGIYSVASKIPMILQTFISILQAVWQISTNEIYEEEYSELKQSFEIFTRYFRGAGFISGSLLIVCSPFLMKIVAQNEFYEGWEYVPFLILSVVFSFAAGMVAALYGAYGNNKGIFYSVVLGGGINILLNFVLIPRMGVLGATVSTAISRLIIAMYRLKDTEKFLKFDRGYRSIFVNCSMITFQCVALIEMEKFVYLVQMLFVIAILIINRDILLDVNAFLKKLKMAYAEKRSRKD